LSGAVGKGADVRGRKRRRRRRRRKGKRRVY